MNTRVDDDDLDIPEIDFSGPWLSNRYARKPGEKHEICIDEAVGYSLRLIPSNKILARFRSTLEAWPAIIETVESGKMTKDLALLVGPQTPWLTTEDFLAALDENLRTKVG